MKDTYLVTQGNNLIEARHKKPLTAREQKIVLTMVSMIQPSDEDFKDYRISIKDFSEMLDLKGSVKYTQMKEVAENLMTKTIEIPKSDGSWILANWISSAEYKKGEGVIALSFSPKLKPYMLQLKNQFTSYRLGNVLSLNSVYSIRLYELIKKWQHLGKWKCSVVDLRAKLGVVIGTYPRYANFKARVLNTAITEVNEKTDVHIKFVEVKKGRSVDRIDFTIRRASEKEIKPIEDKKRNNQIGTPEIEEVFIRLNNLADKKLYQFSRNYFSELYQTALHIWKEAAESELVMLIEYVNVEKSVQNPLGFIKSELQVSWKAHERGEQVTFANLSITKGRRNIREEVIPDWFNKKERDSKQEEKQDNLDIAARREKLQKELEEMRAK